MILHLLVTLPILLVAWLAILAIVLRNGNPAPAVFVPFPPGSLVVSLAVEFSVTGALPISLTLQGNASDFVARVQAAGARLVLPAGLEARIPVFLRETLSRADSNKLG